MRCIAIDDEPLALKILTSYCGQIPSIRLLGAYTDPLEGLSAIFSMQPDLLFLDIRMPDVSGMSIADTMKKDALIIFTTAHREYAVEGFDLNVVDYLLKPFDFERFMTAYSKAGERFSLSVNKPVENQRDDVITFRCNYQNVRLSTGEILYVKALDNYVKIVTADKNYMTNMTMKRILAELPESEFVRIHKSFIIPVARIKSYTNEMVTTDAMKIAVGRSFRKSFHEKMLARKQTVLE
jgi:DNA-binding LytR/AlgR family response regulator